MLIINFILSNFWWMSPESPFEVSILAIHDNYLTIFIHKKNIINKLIKLSNFNTKYWIKVIRKLKIIYCFINHICFPIFYSNYFSLLYLRFLYYIFLVSFWKILYIIKINKKLLQSNFLLTQHNIDAYISYILKIHGKHMFYLNYSL